MDDALLGTVLDRLDDDATLDDQAQWLVLAACQGDADLDTALRDESLARPAVGEAVARVEPPGAYLQSITVEGFRGVGAAQTLELTPGPGFTLVVGRNGSGKSSFAEAVELLLTGDSLRWSGRSRIWQEGWRNLHNPHARVETGLAVEGQAGTTTVRCAWGDGDDLADAATVVQPYGQPRTDLAALGWDQAMATYRPFLSYNELGSMLDDGPSKVYDALEAILGLGELNAAAERLRQARLERERATKDVKGKLQGLLSQLDASEDPRAQACHAALAGRQWRLEEVERILADRPAADAGDEIGVLRALACLDAPDPEAVATAVAELRAAVNGYEQVASTDAADADRLADLLERALGVHDHRGDGDCPVCGRAGALDAAWHDETEAEVARLRGAAKQVRDARSRLEQAERAARGLVTAPPPVLAQAAELGFDLGAAPERWRAWSQGAGQAEDPAGLADHLEEHCPLLVEAVGQARKTATEELERRQDAWRPLARDLHAWLADAWAAEAGAEQVEAIKAGEKWLKDTAAAIRDDRFAPLADACQAHWRQLRQHSNVELGRVGLEGGGTRRRVSLDVTVDGVEGAALGVMSQGELHALALSLFLPRATLPDSPFRFLVIDDPVQSMDPARVDGLARVFASVAETRQVVVFTHDDRLAEAVRRLDLPARVVEVTRRANSAVELREVTDPVERHLEDARALASTADVPEQVAQRVVGGFCRTALEAASIEAFRRRRLARGEPHFAVETAVGQANTAAQIAALALFDDADRAGDVYGRLGQFGPRAVDTFKACAKGTHGAVGGDLHGLIDEAVKLARGLRRQ